jgi:hypothetical protein
MAPLLLTALLLIAGVSLVARVVAVPAGVKLALVGKAFPNKVLVVGTLL